MCLVTFLFCMHEQCVFGPLLGLQFHLSGYDTIPTDGSGRILITDIRLNDYSTTADDAGALLCQSGVETAAGNANWYLHPTQLSTAEGDRIQSSDPRGWSRNRGIDSYYHRLVRLKRYSTITAEEGVFTCHVVGDINTPVSVGIYYPSKWIQLTAIITLLKVHLCLPCMSLFYSTVQYLLLSHWTWERTHSL